MTAKLLTTEYKPTALKLKLDEDPIQRRIYFFTHIKSLQMIFKVQGNLCGTCRLPNYRKERYKYRVKKAISNILHANIDARSRRLISEFPTDGVNCHISL